MRVIIQPQSPPWVTKAHTVCQGWFSKCGIGRRTVFVVAQLEHELVECLGVLG